MVAVVGVVAVIEMIAMAIVAAMRALMVAMMVLVVALALELALVQIIHYNYRLIEMASYTLHTFAVYTYFGMCTNHKPNHLHSIR